jgi:Ca2+-binding RTX toxin-like protein
MMGGEGNDTFMWQMSESIDDILDGGAGSDTVMFTGGAVAKATLDNMGSVWVDRAPEDTVNAENPLFADTRDTATQTRSIENLTGTALDDILQGNVLGNTLTGGDGADTLSGLARDDKLDGGRGDDILYGGADNDTLIGGAGADALDGGTRMFSGVTVEGGMVTEVELTDSSAEVPLADDRMPDKFTGGAGGDAFIWGAGDTITDFGGANTADTATGRSVRALEGDKIVVDWSEVMGAGDTAPTASTAGTPATFKSFVTVEEEADGLAITIGSEVMVLSGTHLSASEIDYTDFLFI